jgi:hypothetical protein
MWTCMTAQRALGSLLGSIVGTEINVAILVHNHNKSGSSG